VGVHQVANFFALCPFKRVIDLIHTPDIGIDQYRRIIAAFDNSKVRRAIDADHGKDRVGELV
jgi:hypothetical protein